MQDGDADLVLTGLTYVQINDNGEKKFSNRIPNSFNSTNPKRIGTAIPDLEYMRLLNGPVQKRFKKHIIELNGISFNLDISHGEDTLFVLQYMQYINSMTVVGESDYFYNQYVQNSLTKSHAKYKEAYHFAEEMYRLRIQMSEKFKIENRDYRNYLQALYQEYLFVSIYALYYHRIEKSERIRFLRKVYNVKRPIRYGANKKLENVLSTALYRIGIPKLSDFLYCQVLWGNRKF